MKEPAHHDPFDVLSEVYEKMYERAAQGFHQAEEKTLPLLHKLIDDAREKAVELKEVSAEDAEKLAEALKRDMSEALAYLSETGHELKDWLGFETTLLESGILDFMLKAADTTKLKLQEFQENVRKAAEFHTGEIMGPGTLVCDACGEVLHFYKAGRVPPCPRCHATRFHRQSRR
jgi:hypothetical protein